MKVSFLLFFPTLLLSIAQLHGQITVEDYESTGYTLNDSIGLYTGWSVTAGTATISDTQSQEQPSGQSLLFSAGSPIGSATRTVQVSEWGSGSVGWWDFWVLPVAHSETSASYTVEADGTKVEFRSPEVVFDQLDIISYGTNQDGQSGSPTTATVSAGGSTIRLEGNAWKSLPYEYTITEDTVLTFEVDVVDAGEIIGIVLDTDNIHNNGSPRAFQLAGSDTNWSQALLENLYTGPGYETITISVGQHLSGSISYIGLVADDDSSHTADVTFRNVTLHEGSLPVGDSGELVVTDGSTRVALPEYFSVTGNEADAWMRLTLRQDYTNGVWDLYVDGQSVPVAANLAFDGTPTEPTSIKINGDTTFPVYVDLLQLATTSPIFTDADNDGMFDTWETDHGLDNTVNDRDLDLDRDDLTNLEEYVSGLDPSYFYDSGKQLFVHFTADSPEEYGDFSADTIVAEGANNVYQHTGSTVVNSGEVIHSELFPIDASREYRFTASFKAVGTEDFSRVYLGMRYFTEDGTLIEGYQRTRQGNASVIDSWTSSEIVTELATAPSGWRSGTQPAVTRYLGFYYDGVTTKLPDYVIIDETNGVYSAITGTQITLTTSLPTEVSSNLVAGQSVVMNHLRGSANAYLWSSYYAPSHWTTIVAQNVTGEGEASTNFHYDTAFAQIALLLNYNQSASSAVYFDDIIIEEVIDQDADGLPDWWEREMIYGKDPLDAYTSIADVLTTDDYDGDGLDTLGEYQSGTNPFFSDNISHNIRRYVDNLFGSSGFNGRNPYPRIPSWNSGPKATITQAINASPNIHTIIMTDHGPGFDQGNINLLNKTITLRLNGDVTLRGQ